jgi:hypothetical protein
MTTAAPARALSVSPQFLRDALLGLNGAQFAAYTAVTEPKMTKTIVDPLFKGDAETVKAPRIVNPYVDRVVKVNYYGGMVNFKYDEGVLRRLAKENAAREKAGVPTKDFEGGEGWHRVVCVDGKMTPICVNKKIPVGAEDTAEDFYLWFAIFRTRSPRYFDIETGAEIAKDEIAPYLPKRTEYANQGLDNPLVYRIFKMAGIRRMRIGGECYEIDYRPEYGPALRAAVEPWTVLNPNDLPTPDEVATATVAADD